MPEKALFTEAENHLFLQAKARAIAIPVDLDSQVNTLSLKVHSTMVQRAAKDWRISARSRPRKEPLGGPDYRNIIEKLQVNFAGVGKNGRIGSSYYSKITLMCPFVGYRVLSPFWRSSSVQKCRRSFLFSWTFFTVLSCCFQRRLSYVKKERSCPSKPPSVLRQGQHSRCFLSKSQT